MLISDFFLCSQGPNFLNFGPIPDGIQVTFFPNFEKKSQSSKNIFFFFADWDFHSVNTYTSYMVTFSFNLMTIVCVLPYLFLLTKIHNCALLLQISQFRGLPG